MTKRNERGIEREEGSVNAWVWRESDEARASEEGRGTGGEREKPRSEKCQGSETGEETTWGGGRLG